MINGKRVLAIIPARGGSKGVPRKNIREIGGKPLIAWTIEAAKKSRYIDRLILSSEDEEIIRIAREWGCEVPFLRPRELAQDTTPGVEPALHALKEIPGFDYLIVLQPTSPLRTVDDIDGALKKCIDYRAKSCVTVTTTDKNPHWMYYLIDHRLQSILDSRKFTRRQDLPRVYALNGAVYVVNVKYFLQSKSLLSCESVAYEMPKERSIDIDDDMDFKMAEWLLLRDLTLDNT